MASTAVIIKNDGLAGGGTVIDTTFDTGQPSVAQPAIACVVVLVVDDCADAPAGTGVALRTMAASVDPVNFGVVQDTVVTIAAGTNYPTGGAGAPTVGTPSFYISALDGWGDPIVGFNIGTMSEADVGAMAVMVVTP